MRIFESFKDAEFARDYYEKIVEIMRKSNGFPGHYFNHFPWQIGIVFDNLMKYAEDTAGEKSSPICMFSSDLDFDFLPSDFQERLVGLSQKGCELKIVLACPPQGDSLKKWQALKRKIHSGEIRNIAEYDEKMSHVWTYKDAYRWELPHPKSAKEEITAVSPDRPARFAFHNESDANKVREYFDLIWNKATLLSA